MIDLDHLISVGFIIVALYLLWENYKNNEVIEEMCSSLIEIADKHNALAKMCEEMNEQWEEDNDKD